MHYFAKYATEMQMKCNILLICKRICRQKCTGNFKISKKSIQIWVINNYNYLGQLVQYLLTKMLTFFQKVFNTCKRQENKSHYRWYKKNNAWVELFSFSNCLNNEFIFNLLSFWYLKVCSHHLFPIQVIPFYILKKPQNKWVLSTQQGNLNQLILHLNARFSTPCLHFLNFFFLQCNEIVHSIFNFFPA